MKSQDQKMLESIEQFLRADVDNAIAHGCDPDTVEMFAGTLRILSRYLHGDYDAI